MSRVICHVSISLDGFLAGPDQSFDEPLGVGGKQVHQGHFRAEEPGHEIDAALLAELLTPSGAVIMGRNMFGPVRGDWDSWHEDWRGGWGDGPPYPAPVFVPTHLPD